MYITFVFVCRVERSKLKDGANELFLLIFEIFVRCDSPSPVLDAESAIGKTHIGANGCAGQRSSC